MNETQAALLSMYKDVKRVLERNGIEFYCHFGTALGAVRHSGFIPWDDDIDLVVWEKDIPEVNRALSEGLDPSDYYYHIPSADNHPHVISLEKGEEGLINRDAPFIDIFPISDYPSGKARRILTDAMIWGDNISIYALDRVKSPAIHRRLRWTHESFSKLARMTAGEKCRLTTIHSTEFKDYIFKKEDYGKSVMHAFEDTEIPLPQEWDRMLEHMFGDYMTPPPEGGRKGAGGFPCGAYIDFVSERKGRGTLACPELPSERRTERHSPLPTDSRCAPRAESSRGGLRRWASR